MSTTLIQHKRGTKEQWDANSSHVLEAAEIGVELDTNKFKIGNGVSTWAELAYQSASSVETPTLSKKHTQSSQQSVWTISYSLPFTPNVTATDINGNIIEGDVDYVDSTTITITFSQAYSGYAYLS